MRSYFLRSASSAVLLYRMPPMDEDQLRGILVNIAKNIGIAIS